MFEVVRVLQEEDVRLGVFYDKDAVHVKPYPGILPIFLRPAEDIP